MLILAEELMHCHFTKNIAELYKVNLFLKPLGLNLMFGNDIVFSETQQQQGGESMSYSHQLVFLCFSYLFSEWQGEKAYSFEHHLMLCVCTERDTTIFNPNTYLLLTCLATN